MASEVSDPEQPKLSFFERILKKDGRSSSQDDMDGAREPLVTVVADRRAEDYSRCAAILPFLFPALGGLLYGYDIGATSGASVSLESAELSGTTWYNLSSIELGVVVSGSVYGALIGSIVAFNVADFLGRRRELIVSSTLYIIGALITALAPDFAILVIGRLVYGVGIGLTMHAAPMYIAETAPMQIRGLLISLKECFIVLGMLLGYTIGSLEVDLVGGWRYMYATSIPLSIIMFIGMLWLPASPRWLLLCAMQNRDNTEEFKNRAVCAFCKIRGQPIDIVASEHISEMLVDLSFMEEEKQASFREVFQGKCLKALIIGCGVVFFQQVTGQPSVLYYAATILQTAGFTAASESTRVSILLGFLKLIATGVAVLVVDKVGRRPLLITGVTGIIVSLFMLAGYYLLLKDIPFVAVIALLLYVSCYQLSFGPIGWLLISEIFPLRLRGRGLSIAVLVNFGANALVTFAFSPLRELLGAGILFAGFGVIAILSLIFIIIYVPETKGLTLEEIEAKIL
ncbi:D-xylose-proton symporter-like 2 [Nymphaea colorata]|nr:D-xylose-proton symporter-like 2 [Nymphaea colorata]